MRTPMLGHRLHARLAREQRIGQDDPGELLLMKSALSVQSFGVLYRVGLPLLYPPAMLSGVFSEQDHRAQPRAVSKLHPSRARRSGSARESPFSRSRSRAAWAPHRAQTLQLRARFLESALTLLPLCRSQGVLLHRFACVSKTCQRLVQPRFLGAGLEDLVCLRLERRNQPVQPAHTRSGCKEALTYFAAAEEELTPPVYERLVTEAEHRAEDLAGDATYVGPERRVVDRVSLGVEERVLPSLAADDVDRSPSRVLEPCAYPQVRRLV